MITRKHVQRRGRRPLNQGAFAMQHRCLTLALSLTVSLAAAQRGHAAPTVRTTLSDSSVDYQIADEPYVVLTRAGVEAVIVDNREVDDEVLPGHRDGYNGVGSLKIQGMEENLFVPTYAGLNFEHIHDGTTQQRKILFEPRFAPMQLRIIDAHTVELYQAPTPHYQLESCTRYQLLEDGALQMVFECIPRAKTFQNGYIGLFWANYIHQPESLDIHFKGRRAPQPNSEPHWIQASTPEHGVQATHVGCHDSRTFDHAEDFPLTLVFNRSPYHYEQPWYFGICRDRAYVLMFRPSDQVRFSQSPSGGGQGNPAWDFQYLIADYEVDECYQMVVRAMLIPYESIDQVEKATKAHREALGMMP